MPHGVMSSARISTMSRISLSLCFLVAACTPSKPAPVKPSPAGAGTCDHVVVIDAGSSGTRVHLYQQGPLESGVPATQKSVFSEKVRPGLSSYVDNPQGAADSLRGLFEGEGKVLSLVGEGCLAATAVSLMGTAGMRKVGSTAEGKAKATAIYNAVRTYLQGTGLDVRFVGTIPGQHEAVYGWITVNYGAGRLGDDSRRTFGALDLGGESTQITFAPDRPPGEHAVTVRFGSAEHTLYAVSYLGFGQDKARSLYGTDACFPRGLRTGTGDYAACATAVAAPLKVSACRSESCGLPEPGTEMGVYQPELPGQTFYAFEAYEFTREALNIESPASPAEFAAAGGGADGTSGFCGRTWTDITGSSDTPAEFLEGYCFAAAWIPALLRGFGFAEDAEIEFASQIGDVQTGWTAGAAVCMRADCLARGE